MLQKLTHWAFRCTNAYLFIYFKKLPLLILLLLCADTDLIPIGAGVQVQGAQGIRLREDVHVQEFLTGDGQLYLGGQMGGPRS